MTRIVTLLIVLLGWAGIVPDQISAQSLVPGTSASAPEPVATEIDAPLTKTEAEALVSRLSDSEVRAILLNQLGTKDEAAEEDGAEGGFGEFLRLAAMGPINSVWIAVERLPVLVTGQVTAFGNMYERHGGWSGLGTLAGMVALIIALGLAAEFIFTLWTRKFRNLLPQSEDMGLGATLKQLAQRLAIDFLGVIIFLIVTRIGAQQFIHADALDLVNLLLLWLVVLPRLALAFGRFMMAPQNPAYRIIHTDDATAIALTREQVVFMVLIGFSVVMPTFNQMYDVPMGQTRLGFWLNLAVHLYVIYLAWRYSPGLQMMMRGADADELTPTEERVARLYPGFTIAVSVLMWWVVSIVASVGTPEAFAMLRSAPHYKTMLLLIFAPAMDTAIRGLVKHLVPPMQGEGAVAERAYYATKRSFIRIARVLVFGLVLIAIADFWGMSPASLANAGVGERVAADFLSFLFVLALGYLVYEVVGLMINRKLAAEITASGYDPDNADFGGDGGGAGGSRLSTVLPLVRAVAQVAIIVLFVLLALSNAGVDTTPLLAGAGIVGLAVGFGAQKLVTDVVSGIFFLVDDAFRTGEYVEVEGTMGTVERISIRSLQLRHHKGPVHTLPYGEIPKITNFSRDWVIMKLKFTVPFDTDPNKVKKIFKKIGAEMLEHETLGQDFLQPFKSQGVFEIDDVGIVVRGKFMAKPGKQFMIRKEIYNRVKAEFDAAGIDFARREVRVAIPGIDDKHDLTEEDKAAIAAAASASAQEHQGNVAGSDDR